MTVLSSGTSIMSAANIKQLTLQSTSNTSDFEEYIQHVFNRMYPSKALVIMALEDSPSFKTHSSPAETTTRSRTKLKDKDGTAKISIFDIELDRIPVHMCLVYQGNKVTQIKLVDNKLVPRDIFQIVSIIITYHKQLTSVVMNKGLDTDNLYGIVDLLATSQITELCLDGAVQDEVDFQILLERPTCLQNLSLARCCLGDNKTVKICKWLVHPLPASRTLTSLNLSTNGITNVGARAISHFLRTNRTLVHLNLANNYIDDDGGKAILNILKPFPMSEEEIITTRIAKMMYLRKLNIIIQKNLKLLTSTESHRKTVTQEARRRSKKYSTAITSGSMLQGGIAGMDEDEIYSRAKDFAKKELGIFVNPLDDQVVQDNVKCSVGNRTLAYLNIAYNQLRHFFLETLVAVFQNRANDMKRGGIVNVVIQGNPLPITSPLYDEIDKLQEHIFMDQFNKKRKSNQHKVSSKRVLSS